MRPPARSAFALLLPGLVAPLASLAAQHVRGVVRDSAAQQPIGGAVVWVSDSVGRFLARAIADEAGRYSVMRLDGSAVLHVVRIGYHPLTLPIARAPAGADTTIDVRLGSIALTLGAISESRSRVCPGEQGTNAALELWEQARAALLASVVSRDAGAPTLVMKSFSRMVDPTSHQISDQRIHTRHLVGDESYVAALPASMFVAHGYMQEHNADRTFYAPDDEVLLDPTFAGTHCLRVVDGGTTGVHAGDLGIAFAPVADRERDTLVDVQGVLWMAKTAHELHSLEFHYTDLEHEADLSGGEIAFQTMPTGAPMITHWIIRSAKLSAIDAPVVPGIRRRLFDRRDRKNVRLIAIREDGGYVVSASWPNGRQWRAPLRTIVGQLVSDAKTPVAGMSVWLENTGDTTVTDADGAFTLRGVLPGAYLIMAADSSLAKVGVVRGRRSIDVLEGDNAMAHVLYFPLARITQLQCGRQPHDQGTGALLGRVVDESGNPLTDVDLDATWTTAPPGSRRAPHPDRSTETDETGRFAICGAPIGAKVKLHAVTSSSATDVEWVQVQLLTMTFVIHSTAQ